MGTDYENLIQMLNRVGIEYEAEYKKVAIGKWGLVFCFYDNGDLANVRTL